MKTLKDKQEPEGTIRFKLEVTSNKRYDPIEKVYQTINVESAKSMKQETMQNKNTVQSG